jgi:hypothetical protein
MPANKAIIAAVLLDGGFEALETAMPHFYRKDSEKTHEESADGLVLRSKSIDDGAKKSDEHSDESNGGVKW